MAGVTRLFHRGWVARFRLSELQAVLESLDRWLRRRPRCILWQQWKRHGSQFKELCRRGQGLISLREEHRRLACCS
ncbi:MAG: hypothetical protein KKB50_06015 [Planctomycetes bacterium]|nr:hypothetical protein [Planctomycetota bacterium]